MKTKLKKIFEDQWICTVHSIQEIDIWFTNKVYNINDKYVVKICTKIENEASFEKEVFLYRLFDTKLPVPKVIYFDTSKIAINHYFYICNKIDGDNLYSIWHTLKENERKSIIQTLCNYLKIINSYWKDKFINTYWRNETTWKNQIMSDINNFLRKIEEKNILNKSFLNILKKYLAHNAYVLNEEIIGIVYWDVHFDNILVKDGNISGILDFEWSDLMSIDYVLDLANRLQNYPTIYTLREEDENNIKEEDYKNIMQYYRESYPELFTFKDIEKRIALYSIKYDLRLLLKFPNSENLKERLLKTLKI